MFKKNHSFINEVLLTNRADESSIKNQLEDILRSYGYTIVNSEEEAAEWLLSDSEESKEIFDDVEDSLEICGEVDEENNYCPVFRITVNGYYFDPSVPATDYAYQVKVTEI